MLKKLSGIILILLSCSTVNMTDQEVDQLIEYEKGEYVLLKDIVINAKTELKKNTHVKLLVSPQSNWIKVYAYPAKQTKLKSKRTRILYMFKEDFPNEIYNYDFFNKELMKIVKPIKK